MRTALVVDDNRMIRALVSQVLREHGFEPHDAEDGLTGYTVAREIHPAIIIADYYMPEMDGAEMVRKIRQDSEIGNTPIIGLAGTQNSEQALTDAGVNKFLKKPMSEKQLLDAITELLST